MYLCAFCSVMKGVCSQTHYFPWRHIDCVGSFSLLSASKALLQIGTDRIMTESRQLFCFLFLFFLSKFDMKVPQARGHSVVKCLLAFFLLLTLIDNAPIFTYRCWGQQYATIAYSSSCVYAADDKWGRTHISPLRTSRSFLPGNGFTSMPSSPSIRPRTESIVF